MKKNNSRPIALLAVGLLWAGIHAQSQESVNTSGNDATGNGGSVAYSIGQIVYTTNMASSGSVAQGVQHAYEIFTVGTKEAVLTISLSAFPNPTVDNLKLQVDDYNNEKLSYHLYDLNGILLAQGQIIEQQTQINTASLTTATYFIHIVNQQNQKVHTFKFIKN